MSKNRNSLILHIDTSDSTKTTVGLKIGNRRIEISEKNVFFASQAALLLIEKMLKKHNLSLGDIRAINVNPGPGSFTGLRVGVAIANALGWALNVPVNGQDVRRKPMEPSYI